MKKQWITMALLMVISATGFSQDGGWQPLFDGKTLQGWHLYKKPGTAPAWSVKDGAIYLDITQKDGRGDLVTDQEYGDFILQFDWKVAPGSNSGVIFLAQEQDPFKASWHTGPEFQVIDNTGYPDKLGAAQMAGSLYDLIPCPPALIRPTGDWNQAEIRLQQGRLEFVLNGQKAVSVLLGSDEWTALINKSKFASMKDFARFRRGRIALQDHNGEVWYRNIRIKSL